MLQRLSSGRLQVGLAGFIALSIAVVSNILFLQPAPAQRSARMMLGTAADGQTAAVRQREPAIADDTGATTRGIQRELELRGYFNGVNDGVANLATRAAVMAYETEHGLPLIGEPTEALLRAVILGTADTETPAALPQRVGPHAEEVIRTVQQSLVTLGFGPLKIDGVIGEPTALEIRRFERHYGLPETGRISSPFVVRLAKLAGLGQTPKGR